jgi:hypothetical protein
MFFIIITQFLELQIPNILEPLGIEIETNLVDRPFSFLIQFASFEECTLRADPNA